MEFGFISKSKIKKKKKKRTVIVFTKREILILREWSEISRDLCGNRIRRRG